MTASSLTVAAAARLKPKWTVLPELLVHHFSGITESSGEAGMVWKNRRPHPGANGHIATRHPGGRGRGAAQVPASVQQRRLWRMRFGRRGSLVTRTLPSSVRAGSDYGEDTFEKVSGVQLGRRPLGCFGGCT